MSKSFYTIVFSVFLSSALVSQGHAGPIEVLNACKRICVPSSGTCDAGQANPEKCMSCMNFCEQLSKAPSNEACRNRCKTCEIDPLRPQLCQNCMEMCQELVPPRALKSDVTPIYPSHDLAIYKVCKDPKGEEGCFMCAYHTAPSVKGQRTVESNSQHDDDCPPTIEALEVQVGAKRLFK